MHYYVDGYNLLFRICHQSAPLQKRRDRLIDILNQELRFMKGRCTLLFDSAEQLRESPQSAFLENLEVVYTPKGLTADQYIIELVEHSRNLKTLTIVTSDSGLGHQCRYLGSNVMTIEAFIAFIIRKTHKKEEEKPFKCPSDSEIERLQNIFEERLNREDHPERGGSI